ncbi:innexin-16, partial [Aphelenchoides avenae]
MAAQMNRLPGVLNVISQPRNEEDFVDRLNYKTTTYIVLAAALTIFAKEYGGDPIRCWADATWPDAWVQYAHDICFVENTYFVNGSIPRNQEQRRFQQIGYYQWIPFILVLQAIFCNLPHLFWRSLNWTSGLQLRAVVTMANEARKTGPLAKANVRDTVARHIYDSLLAKAMYLNMGRNGNFVLRVVRLITHLVSHSYLATLYCISKVLNVANTVMQVLMLGHFLGQSSHFWGFSMLSAMQRGETWEDTGLFPRVVVCDFE